VSAATKKKAASGKRVKDALGGQHEGKKDSFLLDPDKIVLVEDRGSALFDERVFEKPVESMVLNIMAIGVHTPITVRRNPETGDIECVAGRRRIINNREANRRLRAKGAEPRWIPATVKRGEAAELFDILTSENEQRAADSPMNRARKMQRMLDLGRDEAHVGKMFGVGAATVKNTTSLLDLPRDIQRKIDSGELPASDGYKMKGMEPSEQKRLVDQLAVEAPKAEGKKRRSNAAKAREILGDKPARRSAKVIEEKIGELECLAKASAKVAVAALRWAMGAKEEPEEAL
jgi:ParB family chromosome partitioning protein